MAEDDTVQRLRDAAYIPDHRVEVVPSPRRVRVVFGGEVVADSLSVQLLHRRAPLSLVW